MLILRQGDNASSGGSNEASTSSIGRRKLFFGGPNPSPNVNAGKSGPNWRARSSNTNRSGHHFLIPLSSRSPIHHYLQKQRTMVALRCRLTTMEILPVTIDTYNLGFIEAGKMAESIAKEDVRSRVLSLLVFALPTPTQFVVNF